MAWKETEKGSASTAASFEMPSGTGISMESCAASCSAQAPGGAGDDTDVHAGAQVALGKAPAEAQVSRLARGAHGLDAAWRAGQPRVEDDALADVETAGLGAEVHDLGDDLVAGHVGE